MIFTSNRSKSHRSLKIIGDQKEDLENLLEWGNNNFSIGKTSSSCREEYFDSFSNGTSNYFISSKLIYNFNYIFRNDKEKKIPFGVSWSITISFEDYEKII